MTGVGGPPMALTYQHSDPRVLRASLATFNSISILSFTIPLLAIAGATGWHELRIAVAVTPGVLAGLWVGKHLIARLRPELVRTR